MKQLLYFLIGVLISACLMIPYAKADCVDVASGLSSSDQIVGHSETSSEASALAESARQSGAGSDAIGTCSSGEPGWWDTAYQSITVNGVTLVCMRNKYGCWDVSGVPVLWGPWYCASYGTQTACIIGDTDGDGIPNEYDAYPDDPNPYQFRIMSRWYDSSNNCVGYAIVTSNGDYIFMSDLTLSELDAGLAAGTYTSQYVNSQIWQDSSDMNGDSGAGADSSPSGTLNTPLTSTKAGDLITGSQEGVTSGTPTTSATPGSGTSNSEGSTTGDSDSTSLGKIVGNTDATNQNLKNISESLGIANNLLAKINSKSGTGTGTGTLPSGSGPDLTADEIGDAVEDSLIDPTQTIDTTITDNILDLDETETLTAIKTKYSDRYDLFIDTLKESDLFTLPFSIFTGPSGSGSSIQTVEIGAWGQSSTQTATINFSQYDNVWDILSAVLLMLTSFACFKILVLKKA
ncbi:hypothetical protein [Desulfobacter vibrioformis]|uniref:hypothetical protein n=1 Tax=Desulfobacter vibrioformis TaxID=34031 RepID=UPI0006919B6E|nr:hypothetical protein [Desulfobacter vibrioformis]